ncbi:MAG TPA: cache domain-containing protein [Syntrophales bacterium]|nr:cache domain-containing protein [Syntrophales bacterium]
MKFHKLAVAIFICLFVVTSAYAQQRGTPIEAKKLVEQAVAYVNANGEEKALKEFKKPRGKFFKEEEYLFGYDLKEVLKDDLYIFAYDLKGVMKANPMVPKLVGKNLYNEPDSKGKLFRKEIVDLANSRGSGWVDYAYMNPVTKEEEFKITYCQKVGNLIVCCGAYLP